MLVSTHNLGSVPDYCDRAVLLADKTVLDAGPTDSVFTRINLERAFGGTLRHFVLGGADLHDDDDARRVTVITDDERPSFSTAIRRRAPCAAHAGRAA